MRFVCFRRISMYGMAGMAIVITSHYGGKFAKHLDSRHWSGLASNSPGFHIQTLPNFCNINRQNENLKPSLRACETPNSSSNCGLLVQATIQLLTGLPIQKTKLTTQILELSLSATNQHKSCNLVVKFNIHLGSIVSIPKRLALD